MAESDSAPDADDARDKRTDLRAQTARALARGGMSGVQVLSWAAADEVLTPKQRELIETLRTTDADSVRALARELDGDKGQVSRDLGTLAEHGIVRYETMETRNGRGSPKNTSSSNQSSEPHLRLGV